ncbi:MAG TPA: alanine racemase [Rhizomicrobium sp.]|nr:alanine racemase [Rhizomicrobium sp.]
MTDSPNANASLVLRLDAVVENYRTCRRLSGANVAAVVKADGYGLGAIPVAQALHGMARCDNFVVARLQEGIALRRALPDVRILVLDGCPAGTPSALVAHNLTPILNSLQQVEAWNAEARTRRTKLDAVVHIDTGMNRLGLPADELSILSAEAGERLSGINLVLIMSHLAFSEDPAARMNGAQLARFRAALASLPSAPASLSPSGGICLGRDYAFDLVRPGIALYGGNPQPTQSNLFKPVVRLTGRILQLRRVDKGESVGYGATFHTQRPATLATVGLGYADGLMRAIANRGAGAIGGIRAPVAGRVSMDVITLDVTGIPGAEIGGEVEFIGDTIVVDEIAAAAGTATYEILTNIGKRLPREYVSAS